MPEPITTPDPTEQLEATEQAPQGDPADRPLGPNGEKALKAERDRADAAEKRIREFEQASLSELERAQREAAENKDAAAKATAEALRWRIAAKHQISEEDAETFLTGADEVTITRQAETYAKRIAEARGGIAPGPRPDLTQGPSNTGTPVASRGQQFADFLASN